MKTLVAYFSAGGITARLVETLADAIGAHIHCIEPKEHYTEADLDWRNKQSRSSIEMNNPASRPELARRRDDIEDFDVIFVGFPIWWYTAPTIINTFLESYDFTDKTIVLFATSGGSGMGDTVEKLRTSCPGAKLIEGKILNPDSNIRELAAGVVGLGIQ